MVTFTLYVMETRLPGLTAFRLLVSRIAAYYDRRLLFITAVVHVIIMTPERASRQAAAPGRLSPFHVTRRDAICRHI